MNATAQIQADHAPEPSFTPVGSNLLQRKCACGGTPGPSGECSECRRKRLALQRRATDQAELSSVPPIVHEVLSSPGKPLDPTARALMEPRFGHDFSQVRVHTNAKAAESAQAVYALAYTVGNDVVFGAGRYTPGTSAGRRLLAHELAHTVQQRGAVGEVQPIGPAHTAQTLEREADVQAESVVTGQAAEPGPLRGRLGMARLQRLGEPAEIPTGMSCPLAPDSPAGGGGELKFGRAVRALTPGQQVDIATFVSSWHASGADADVRIDGYASVEGTQAFNWQLSCDRALAVAEEMVTPSAPGAGPGIPSSFIAIFAQGETTEFSTTNPEANRLAVISVSLPTPSPPSTTPTVPPGPTFVCGPDVTAEVSAAVSKVKSSFSSWSWLEKSAACEALENPITGFFAWDIDELHNNAWIHLTYQPVCATTGSTQKCGTSVQVGIDCHYPGSVNYVIFGAMCKLCDGHNLTGFPLGKMLWLIDLYKKWYPWLKGDPTAANYAKATEWAIVGYLGWPATGTPAGDKPACVPTCSLPSTRGSFSVHWVPMGWF